MTNKEKLKKIIEQDINPKDYYNEIISKIEEGKQMNKKNNVRKWSLVPVCFVIVIVGIFFLNYQNSNNTLLKNNPYVDEKNNVILNINEINEDVGMTDTDVDVKRVTDNVNFPFPYKNEIDIPKDFDKTDRYIIYFKENKDSKDYNILGNYEIVYANDNGRSIDIKYSKDYKPVRDYYFDEDGSEITTINNVELKIYKFNNTYFTEFHYNDYNFDIETSNVSEQELSILLVSILK